MIYAQVGGKSSNPAAVLQSFVNSVWGSGFDVGLFLFLSHAQISSTPLSSSLLIIIVI